MAVDPDARAGAGEAPTYREGVVHFWADRLPAALRRALPPGPLALADFGCGDGPLFHALQNGGFIGPSRPVYAVDLSPARLSRVTRAFPYIRPCQASVEDAPGVPTESLDFAISTMVLEHVPDEGAFLSEVRRVLRRGGRAYCTTVFKKPWAWYFRRRDGETVLDPTHLREYTDLDAANRLMTRSGFNIVSVDLTRLRFPLIDPLAFRLFRGKPETFLRHRLLRWARRVDVPIPGYYSLEYVLEK